MITREIKPLYLQGAVIVTGGSGFIGTHLVSALLEAGTHVVNLDIKEPILPRHAPHWVNCDLGDRRAVKAIVAREKPALIYNLAAHARLDGTADEMQINVDGVQSLIDTMDGLTAMPLMVQASTMVVAGPNRSSFNPRTFDPQFGLYAQSKVTAEKLIHALPLSYRWTIVRPSVIWGPYHSTFPQNVWRYIRKRYYLHPTGFDVVRSYGYVGNVVHQLLRIAEIGADAVDGKTFYVGDEPVLSTLWLDAFAIALTGKAVRRVPGWFLRAAAHAGEVSGKLGGPSPINLGRLTRMTSDFPVPMGPTFAVLGPSPVPLEEAVARTASWLKRA